MPGPAVSVIIATHDRKGILKRAIGSVLDQTYSDFGTIIVDDHSIGGTDLSSLGREGPQIRYIRNEERRGQLELVLAGPCDSCQARPECPHLASF